MISVLYVDDETDLLELTKRYLERTGMFAVDTADSAQEALEKIQSTPYDAIVSDYQIPGMDGIQFLQSLRTSGDCTPFIIFTGKGREEVVIQAFENGADAYLQKGGEPNSQFAELAQKVTMVVELRAAERARRESEQKLHDIIDFLPDATFAIDMEGRVIAWNRAIEEMTGVSEGEILGKGNYEHSLPFYGKRRPILIDLALLSDEEIERNYIYVRWENRRLVAESSDARPRGREVVLWGMATPLLNSQGRLIGAIESIRDITDRKQVEEALRESEKRLHFTLKAARSGSWDWDIPTGRLTWSPEFFYLFGIPPDAPPNFETWLAALHPDDRERAMEKIDRAIRERIFLWNEYRIILPDGQERWIGAAGSTTYDKDSHPLRMSGICIDITERKRAEEALRQSEGRFRELFNNISSGVAVFAAVDDGADFVFRDFNRAAERIENIEKANVIGRRVSDVFPGVREFGLLDVFSRVWRTGQPEHHPISQYKDGRIAGWRENFVSPLPSGEIVSVYDDITARKQVEEALWESEKKFRTIFENSPYPISINSIPDGKFIAVNAAFLQSSGYSESEILGKSPVEMGMLSLMDFGKFTSHLLFWGRIENVPMVLVGKGGIQVHVQFSTIPVTINDRPAIMTMTAEITKLQRIEEELLKKNNELSAAYKELAATEEELRQNYYELSKKEQVLQESEVKFRALVEHSLDGILITDFTGNLLFANRAAGLIVDMPDYEAMIGKRNVLEFVAPESQADVLHDFGKVAQGIDAYLVYYTLITETKREILVECIGKKILFGDSTAMLVSMRDVTERKRAEAVLRESENKFATVFRSSPVALTLVSATDGTFVDVNDAFVRNTGYSRDEVIGITSEALGIFSDRSESERMISSLQDQRCVYGMDMKCRIKTGEVRICRFSSGLILMNGKPHILSTIEDITERKATESAVQAIVRSMVGSTGLESLRKITENVSSWLGADCVMIGEIQPDSETVKVLSMLLDGKEVPDFSYTLKGTPCENVAERGFCLYPDNVIRLFPESKDLVELKIRGYVGTSLRDSGGNVIGILCVLSRSPLKPSQTVQEIMDIIAVKAAAEVERIKIESALRKSQYMLAEAMDLANLVNWEYDVRTGIFTFDDRFYALYGTTAEREDGNQMSAEKYAREFIHPGDRDVVAREVEKAIKTTDPHYMSQLEHRIIRRDGKIRHIVVRIGITKDAEGRTIKTHGVNQDITERKRTEDALRSVNRQLTLLTGITRHDIINKITVILGYLEIAEINCRDPALFEYLQKMKSATTAIQSQIKFTRVYQDLGTHEPRWIDLDTVMPCSHVPPTITLTAEVQGVWVFADPMLEKVFFNLLDNSIRHGQRVTGIRVSSYKSGQDLVVVWEDNGIGIAADEKERIFECGFGKNTGLGLFLSREILAVTGITILETGEPGKGARFEITVPDGAYRIQSVPAINCK